MERTKIMPFLFVFFSALLLNVFVISKRFVYPFDPLTRPLIEKYAIVDISGKLLGFKRMVADLAWVDLLLYYGSPEENETREEKFEEAWEVTKLFLGIKADASHHHRREDESKSAYGEFLAHCKRVVSLDPYFYYAYLYGAGALAWNLNRTDEALELLKDGTARIEAGGKVTTQDLHNPYWQMQLYASAIIYRKSGEDSKMVELLELAVKQPGAPNMIKSILANIFQKQGNIAAALKLWFEIYDSRDPMYAERSVAKIEELGPLLHKV